MFSNWQHFLTDEEGAVTVDWVVLTAAIVAITVLFLSDFTSRIDGNAAGLKDSVMPVLQAISTFSF